MDNPIQPKRHAYLILAHNEFELLKLLIERLDDKRNDIFVHIDSKVKARPQLTTQEAGLYILPQSYDVRWADVSVLEAELYLFAYAYEQGQKQGGYAYYHLLSGVDLPIKSQDYIHRFFEEHKGKEFIGFYRGEDLERDIRRKVQRYHIFPRDFRGGQGLGAFVKRVLRAVAIRIQEAMGYQRHPNIHFDKGTQWLSITEELTAELYKNRKAIVSLYHHTFCSDEIAIHSFVANSPFMARVYDPDCEARSAMRHIGWEAGELKDFSNKDFDALASSEALFARKFNSRDMAFINRVLTLSQA